MIVDRTHKRWSIAFLLALAMATAAYVPYHRGALNGPSGNSWPGLAYGIAGTALIAFAGLLGARRKRPSWRIGRAESWLKGHIWLGLLAYPLILFHAGLRLGGTLTTVLCVIFTLVVLTGLLGLVVQRVLPRILTDRVPTETIYEQLDRVAAQLLEESDEAVATVCGPLEIESEPARAAAATAGPPPRGRRSRPPRPLEGSAELKKFYLGAVRPFLAAEAGAKGWLARPEERGAIFDRHRISLPPPLHEATRHLEEICEERRQLIVQRRLHRLMHGWLFVHLPLSTALVVLIVVHAVTALWY